MIDICEPLALPLICCGFIYIYLNVYYYVFRFLQNSALPSCFTRINIDVGERLNNIQSIFHEHERGISAGNQRILPVALVHNRTGTLTTGE